MAKGKHDLWPLFHEELGIPYDEYMLALWIADHGFSIEAVYAIPSSRIERWIDQHARSASTKLKKVPPRKLEPLCYLCGKIANDDMFCSGCKKYVCEGCDQTGVMGDHDVIEHQRSDDDDDED